MWFPFRVDGISPGVQSEVNLYRKYKDFEEAGWDIMAGVRLPSPPFPFSPAYPPELTSRAPRKDKLLA